MIVNFSVSDTFWAIGICFFLVSISHCVSNVSQHDAEAEMFKLKIDYCKKHKCESL